MTGVQTCALPISADHVFPFWDWVGGRYSLWSAVGLPVALAIGMHGFRKLLRGAHAMDEHFRNAAFEKNMPVVLALLGIWYNNFFGATSQAVLPYDESLALLPAYLQQLDMESCGKSVCADGTPVEGDTGMIIWGAAGTDAQHSFFQLLHQGTRLIPADFIAVCQPHHAVESHHAVLMANFFAQTAALMNGAPHAGNPHDRFPGNRPSNSLLLERVTPPRFMGPSASRVRIAYFSMVHTEDIYGQMVVYLRLAGVTPTHTTETAAGEPSDNRRRTPATTAPSTPAASPVGTTQPNDGR